ncbi:MAG: SPOR domain-containing protein, partial [bacterium]
MARAQRKRTAGKKRKKPIPGWMILSTGLVLGLGIATWAVLGPLRKEVQNLPVPSQSAKTKKKAADEVEIAPITSADADYNFYDSLKKDDKSPSKTQSPTKAKPQQSKSPTSNKQYFVQAGSFAKYADADAVKAELAFTGLVANVVKTSIKGKTWYRVVLGPYSGKRKAE